VIREHVGEGPMETRKEVIFFGCKTVGGETIAKFKTRPLVGRGTFSIDGERLTRLWPKE